MTTSAGHNHTGTGENSRNIPVDTFAARLVLARMHAGLTIQDAAARCGLLNQSWSNWERGMRPRDLLDVVEAISQGLGIDRDWLLFGGPLAQEQPRRRRRPSTVGDPTDRTRWLSAAATRSPDIPTPRPVTTRQAPPDNRPSGRAATTAPPPRTRRPARLSRPPAA